MFYVNVSLLFLGGEWDLLEELERRLPRRLLPLLRRLLSLRRSSSGMGSGASKVSGWVGVNSIDELRVLVFLYTGFR